jgi:hypothetical protein
MDFHIVKMYKDKEVNKNVTNIFLSMCDVKVFLTFTFVIKILQVTGGLLMEMVHDRCSTLLTECGTALTTILPILFQYCYKYCYSDSRNFWAVMTAGGLAP